MTDKQHLNYLRRKTADESELWAADRIEQLEAENKRLREELAALKAQEPVAWIDVGDLRGVCNGNGGWVHPEDQGRMVPLYAAPVPSAEVERLTAQRDELLADAERYRWFRIHLHDPDALTDLCMRAGNEPTPEELDAAIDAAIAAAAKEQGK